MLSRWKQGISRISLSGSLLALGACQGSPTLALRWALDEKSGIDEAPILSISPFVCAQHGVFEIEVTATSTDPSEITPTATRKTFPCSPNAFEDPEGTVHGPKLDPGDYRIDVRGLRRSGQAWNYPEDSPVVQQLGPIAFASFSTTIEKEKTVKNTDIYLNVPPPCDDGIDNDRDGVIDQLDIGCAAFPQRANTDEAHESRISLIQPFVTQLGGLKQPTGPALGLSLVAVHVVPLESSPDQGQDCQIASPPQIDFLTCSDTTNPLSCQTLQWSENLPTLEYELNGGCFALGLTGGAIETLDSGSNSFVPKTHTQWKPFRVVSGGANFVDFAVDFSFEQFLSPQSWPLGFSPSIQPVPGLHLSGCTFEQENNALFEVVSYQMRFWDQQTDRSSELAAILGSNATLNPDGWVELPCNRASNLHTLGVFVWTNFYEMEVLAIGQQRNEMRTTNRLKTSSISNSKIGLTNSAVPQSKYILLDDTSEEFSSTKVAIPRSTAESTVCYGKEGLRIPLVPIVLNDTALDRVLLDNGQPPPPCIDCINDDDCRHSTCINSICVPDDNGS